MVDYARSLPRLLTPDGGTGQVRHGGVPKGAPWRRFGSGRTPSLPRKHLGTDEYRKHTQVVPCGPVGTPTVFLHGVGLSWGLGSGDTLEKISRRLASRRGTLGPSPRPRTLAPFVWGTVEVPLRVPVPQTLPPSVALYPVVRGLSHRGPSRVGTLQPQVSPGTTQSTLRTPADAGNPRDTMFPRPAIFGTGKTSASGAARTDGPQRTPTSNIPSRGRGRDCELPVPSD